MLTLSSRSNDVMAGWCRGKRAGCPVAGKRRHVGDRTEQAIKGSRSRSGLILRAKTIQVHTREGMPFIAQNKGVKGEKRQ